MTVPSRALLVKYVAAVLALIGLSVVIMAGVVPAGAAPAAEERPAVARLISAAVGISPPLARLEAGLQMVPRGSVLTDEDRLRANGRRPAPSGRRPRFLSALARLPTREPRARRCARRGLRPDATTRDWTRCYERGNGAVVICPEGYVEAN